MKLLIFIVAGMLFLSGCSKQESPQPTVSPTNIPQVTGEPEPAPVVEDGVVLEVPDVNTAVSSPLTIEGLAPGTWFFEGNIVGEIKSETGETLVTFPLQAQGEWMTEEHVRFEGEADFDAPEGDETVELIIKNDNPSGLPENAKSQSFTLLLEQ